MQKLTPEQRALADAAQANQLNIIFHAYVDITGDLIAGALLGQILFWFGIGKDGTSRAKIEREGFRWIAKTRADWFQEIRITPKQYDRAAKILKDKGMIEIKTMKFNGNPTTHIRIIPEAINAALDAWKFEQVKHLNEDGNEGAASYSPLRNNEIPEAGTTKLQEWEGGYSLLRNNDVPEKAISSYTEKTNKENDKEHSHTETSQAVHESAPPASNDLIRHQETKEQITRDFEQVWSEFPKKEGKAKARQAFERAIRGMGTRKSNGEPYTAAEILAEVILYRQHVERRLETGELERRYIPSGGTWFEREGWADEVPSISSTFDDFVDGIDYNRNTTELRRCAALVSKAPEAERKTLWQRLQQIRAALPY